MTDDFEDHCWKDVITPDVLEVYSCYRRKVFVGPSPALLAVDLYDVVYRGGPRPPAELARTHPSSCGEYAFAAIEPTRRLFAAARAAGLPIFYSTGDVRPESRPSLVTATKRNKPPVDAADYAIRPEFKPQPSDVVIAKQRASVFFGTPLVAHLTQLGVRTRSRSEHRHEDPHTRGRSDLATGTGNGRLYERRLRSAPHGACRAARGGAR